MACRTAKAADPTCTLLVGSLTSVSADWVERAAKAGTFVGADGVSFHSYADDLQKFRRTIELVCDLAGKLAPPGRKLELWNTEWGVTDTTFDADLPNLPPRRLLPAPSFLDGAAEVVKRDCLSMALGVKRSFYYLHNEVGGAGSYCNWSAIEYTRTPRAKLIARMALEDLTCGAKVAQLLQQSGSGNVTAVVFARGDAGSLAAVWLDENTKARLLMPAGKNVEIFDLFGNPLPPGTPKSVALSAVPIYVTAKISAAEMASLLQTGRMVSASH